MRFSSSGVEGAVVEGQEGVEGDKKVQNCQEGVERDKKVKNGP